MIIASDILIEYCVTEKASELVANLNKYTFKVNPEVNRTQVAQAIEKTFNVKVASVNIMNKEGKLKSSRTQRGKKGRTSWTKKAIVTLQKGDKIELL